MSHILRDVNYLIELASSARVKRFKGLIRQALSLKLTLDDEEKYRTCYERNRIMKSSSDILDADHNAEHEKVQSFFREIGKHRKHLFEFLFNSNVPPDNNASERAIRNVKVKQKISTQYKTEWGIKNYAVIRSVYDTCIKRGVDFFDLAL